MELLKLEFSPDKLNLALSISVWLVVLLVIVFFLVYFFLGRLSGRKFKLTKLEISLGNIGKVEFQPTSEDAQIAHRIWVQLVTRKAAIPFDTEHDVIVEVYDSWYSIFAQTRELVGGISANSLKKNKSTRELVNIAVKTLNEGLRPHLTVWQARFRSWYMQRMQLGGDKSPQQIQKEFPEYDELVADIFRINAQMIQYAAELKKIVES